MKTDNIFVQQMVDYLARHGWKTGPARLGHSFVQILRRSFPEETIVLGAALEMLHVATLIHDDIIDNSAVRTKTKNPQF